MQQENAIGLVCSILNPVSDKAALGETLGQLSAEDWRMLHEAAFKHGLHLLLYHRLKEAGLLMVMPESCREDLREHFLAATARNMMMLHHAGKILQVLRKHGVEVIVLKGLYLAENVYPSIGLRVFGDVDLLLRRADVDGGLALLRSLGYQLSTWYDPQDPNRDIKHLPPLIKEDAPVVELHWNILKEDTPFDIRIDDLWRRAQPARVAGVDVLALGIEDLILHLAVHASYQHGFRGGIRPLYDITAVLQKWQGQVQWDQLARTAREWGTERVLWLTLSLVAEVTGAEVPADFLHGLVDEGADLSMVHEARELLFASGGDATLTPDLAALQRLRNPVAKVRLLLSRIFLPRRRMAMQYNVDPRSLKVYGYYAVRLRDLLRQHGRTGWGMLRGDEGVLAGVDWEETSVRLEGWMERGK